TCSAGIVVAAGGRVGRLRDLPFVEGRHCSALVRKPYGCIETRPATSTPRTDDGGGNPTTRYAVTETVTPMLMKLSLGPKKLPDTGVHWPISRATATGIRLRPPTLRLVGSKVIQPAPGTNTSAQAWVEPASAVPMRSLLGSCR